MTDRERDDEMELDGKKPDRGTLMIWALKNAKEGKKIIVGGQYQKNGVGEKPKKKVAAKSKVKKIEKKVLKRIHTKIPSLDDIKDLAPGANWSGRNILYEACMTEQVNVVLQTLQSQNAPKQLIDHLVALREGMKNGDATETKNALSNLTENWGGSTSSNNKPNYHLLRSFIRMMYETYPLS